MYDCTFSYTHMYLDAPMHAILWLSTNYAVHPPILTYTRTQGSTISLP